MSVIGVLVFGIIYYNCVPLLEIMMRKYIGENSLIIFYSLFFFSITFQGEIKSIDNQPFQIYIII